MFPCQYSHAFKVLYRLQFHIHLEKIVDISTNKMHFKGVKRNLSTTGADTGGDAPQKCWGLFAPGGRGNTVEFSPL